MTELSALVASAYATAPAWMANAGTAIFWYLVIARGKLLPAWPLDGGARLGGRRVFGDSRTVFGSLFMLACAASVGWLQGDAYLGMTLGLLALCGTLANSFLKRRLGAREGSRFVTDHLDYAVAVVVGLWFLGISPAGYSPWWFVAWAFAFQAAVNAAAGLVGIRSEAVHATRP